MPRLVYISCETNERNHEAVIQFCAFARNLGCEVVFPPDPVDYKVMETAIERSDVFVAAVGAGLYDSTWLNHAFDYARVLNQFRLSPRPRLLYLRLDDRELPKYYLQFKLECLNDMDSQVELITEDLPERV